MEYIGLILGIVGTVLAVGNTIVVYLINENLEFTFKELKIKVEGDDSNRYSRGGVLDRITSLETRLSQANTLNKSLANLLMSNLSNEIKEDIDLVIKTDYKGFKFIGKIEIGSSNVYLRLQDYISIKEVELNRILNRAAELKKLRDELCPSKCSTKKPKKV